MQKDQQSVKIKPLTEYWVVVGKNNWADYSTISATRKGCIKLFLTFWVDAYENDWIAWQLKGYRCIKVNIEFKQLK